MEKDKSRGRKHIQDKHKYKGNAVKNPKHVPLPTRPVLESNENRYVEEKQDSHTFQLSSSTDFGILSKTPISRGHHFQFKSDKLIAEEAEAKASGDIFSIDVQAIHNSILTVPFYERIQMDDSYFSESEKRYMKSTAEEHMKIILHKLRGSEVGNKNHNKSKQKDLTISKNADIQKDDSFSPNHTEKVKNSFEDKRAASNNDLEQWLDDILDD